MINPVVNTTKSIYNFGKSFYIPNRQLIGDASVFAVTDGAVILPTHNPTMETYDLVVSLLVWHPGLLVVVVDDASTLEGESLRVLDLIRSHAYDPHLVYLRTPSNRLKAGALNYGLDFLKTLYRQPKTVFVFDDDVKISEFTVPYMYQQLYAEDKIGAVCTKAMVLNKATNLLTRLQALEYHNFNVTKIADNEFLHGPMVMQGMLTAFRMEAINEVDGFALNHLIEDYDITARIKQHGWKVKIAHQATAWTSVPETFESLWKQRVRWTYGGLKVARDNWKRPTIIFQDMFGHILFLTLIALVGISLMQGHDQVVTEGYVRLLLGLAILNFAFGLVFNLVTLLGYPERDAKDWLIKFTLIPEIIYTNIFSLILVGAYLFYMYNAIGNAITQRINQWTKVHQVGLNIFKKFGYSSSWGTKTVSITEGGV